MFDAESLVPRDKHDIAALSGIESAGYPAIAPILDDLLAWTADGNWPVAQPLARFLVTLGTPIVDPLLRVLRGNDSSQKYFCFQLIVEKLSVEVLRALENDLQRLVDRPSKTDQLEGVDELAREALQRLHS
ncbi:DUF5071 domain-containing protein [Rhizobium leguminosarum]|uniref:DUF5071 domain-containing protein n=1 Tax=Rhizobium leguminosarum TaxID=384 RepID=UPI003F96027B